MLLLDASMQNTIPTITLVGRTNVGKSTLFNRLVEQPAALVSRIAGTTRDRKEGLCEWRGVSLRLIDTGGLDVDPKHELDAQVVEQTHIAMQEADLLVFVLDVQTGPLPQDIELAKLLRDGDTPVMVVANKADRLALRESIHSNEWRLAGLPTPLPLSSTHGSGIGDFLDALVDRVKDIALKEYEPIPIDARIALIGKPNVGKSSLLNDLTGTNRMIVSDQAHTTREPHDTLIEHRGKNYLFIDTAGMRKFARTKQTGGLEAAGVERTKRIIEQADVTLFLIDVSKPLNVQDRALAGLLKSKNTGIIIVANKWDLVENKETNTMNEFRDYLARSFPFLRWAPVVFISATTGQRTKTLYDHIEHVRRNRALEISHEDLKYFLVGAMKKHSPKKGKGPVPPKVLDLKQVASNPPKFELIIRSKMANTLATAWVRYLENQLREHFDLEGTPVTIYVRGL